MKIVLSRKGFDSAAGGRPSPILADGTMLPLPIPSRCCPIKYRDVNIYGHNLGNVVRDLRGWRREASERVPLAPDWGAHLDPDLIQKTYRRSPGWRPLFGQADAEVTVLKDVGPGDLFLFFGWFRQAELRDGSYRFVRPAEDIHAVWGWLQVDKKLDLQDRQQAPSWSRYHPHFDETERNGNVLFIARTRLALQGESELPGAGAFQLYDERLRLTAPDQRCRSLWSLPRWFMPRTSEDALGYHGKDMSRWKQNGDQVQLRSVARGQEFVLDCDKYPDAIPWALDLIEVSRRFAPA